MREGDVARRLLFIKNERDGWVVRWGVGGSCERQRCRDWMMTVESAGFAGEDL